MFVVLSEPLCLAARATVPFVQSIALVSMMSGAGFTRVCSKSVTRVLTIAAAPRCSACHIEPAAMSNPFEAFSYGAKSAAAAADTAPKSLKRAKTEDVAVVPVAAADPEAAFVAGEAANDRACHQLTPSRFLQDLLGNSVTAGRQCVIRAFMRDLSVRTSRRFPCVCC